MVVENLQYPGPFLVTLISFLSAHADASTIDPTVSREVSQIAHSKGLRFVDAPVSGGRCFSPILAWGFLTPFSPCLVACVRMWSVIAIAGGELLVFFLEFPPSFSPRLVACVRIRTVSAIFGSGGLSLLTAQLLNLVVLPRMVSPIGVGGAQAGTLTFMVGGPKDEFEAAKEYLKDMGKNIVHCGDAGTGQVTCERRL